MFHCVLQYCKEKNLIEENDCVLVGVSGGADSVCLLMLLQELQKEISFSLAAVHVEHGIRGEESVRDTMFVEGLCKSLGVPLEVYHVEVPRFAKEHGLGIEEAARKLRYECFGKASEKAEGCVKIALAHHGDDNAETVLFQMIRGSRIDGMGGILPKRMLNERTAVIRPLLLFTRAEIEEYLALHGQEYCIDRTNSDTNYSRNKMRKQVLPLLTEINTQAVSHINQSAAYLQEVSAYVKEQTAAAAAEALVWQEGHLLIEKSALERCPALIQKELLHLALSQVAGSAKDLTAKHVAALQELLKLQVGRRLSFPYEIIAERVYEGVALYQESEDAKTQGEVYFSVSKDELTKLLAKGAYEVVLPAHRIRLELIDQTEEMIEISKNTYTKCLDYDKINGSFQIRTRRSGDYIVIDDLHHKKRLKEYFINEKIPSKMRDSILLFTEEEKVLWIAGRRISADLKMNEHTTKILKIQITGGNDYES